MTDWQHIVPDLNSAEEDREHRRRAHLDLFGHEPPEDPSQKCDHPIHAEIRRAMNGAKHEVPFDGTEIITADSAYEQARRERYGIVFEATREFQKQVEEEEAFERVRDMGLWTPR